MPHQRIDVHHHILPPPVVASFRELGFEGVGGVPFPEFDLAQTLEMLAGRSIARAVVSLGDVGPTFARANDAVRISRQYNDFMADLQRNHPQFAAFATLPLPHLDESLAELTRACDELGLHGVMLLSSSEGIYPGDPRLDPLLEELDRRAAMVFVHPGLPPAAPGSQLRLPGFLLEFAFETTRAATNLLLSNVPERFPRIRFVLAHAGGTLPYLASRLILGQTNLEVLQNGRAAAPLSDDQLGHNALDRAAKLRAGLRSFYYDTALSTVPGPLQLVHDLAGTEHLVFGTDFPFVRGAALDVAEQFFAGQNLTAAQREQITRSNALSLFPRLA